MKFKMQDTLRLISQYPLIILFVFSSYFLYLSYDQYNKAVVFEQKLNTTEVLNTLSINIAKERGLSATFIASDGAIAKDTLAKQRLHVNNSMKKFYAFYTTHEANGRIKQIISLLNQISDIRQKVDSLNNVNFNAIFFSYYSQINTNILNEHRFIITREQNALLYHAGKSDSHSYIHRDKSQEDSVLSGLKKFK